MGFLDSLSSLFSSKDQVTQGDVLTIIRKDHPEYATVPDDVLAAAAAKNEPAKYGFLKSTPEEPATAALKGSPTTPLTKFDPGLKLAPSVVPRELRDSSFYQVHPNLAQADAIADLTTIRTKYPTYKDVPDEQLAAAAEKNDPQYKGLLARYKAPELEKARLDTYQKVADVIQGTAQQLKTSLQQTSGAPAVEIVRQAWNTHVAPEIEKLKAGAVKVFAPSDENIVDLTKRTGVIPYPDIAYRTAFQTIVSAVPSSLEDFGLWAVTPEAVAVLKKVPGLRTSMTELFGLKGSARNPFVMPEGFAPPGGEPVKPDVTFADNPQKLLAPGEEPGMVGAGTPRPLVPAAPDLKKIPTNRTEGNGFSMQPAPDLAAFQETRGYSPKTGESITRQGYRQKGPSPELQNFEANLSPQDQSMLADLRRGVLNQVKTSEVFRDKATGNYAPDRAALHKKIQTDPFYNKPEAKAPEGEAPIVRIVIGPPAAGKSSGMKSLFGQKALDQSIIVDNDEIKSLLPGWDPKKAELFHQESSDIEEKIIQHALEQGYNITQPILGKNPNKVEKLMSLYKENGYRVELYHVDLPADKAAERTISRVREGGRFVDPRYVLDEVGLKPKVTYDKLKVEADTYGQVSNDVKRGEPPQFIERGTGDSSRLLRSGRSANGLPDQGGQPSAPLKTPLPTEVTKPPEFGKAPSQQADLFGGAPEDLVLRGADGEAGGPVSGGGDQTRIPGTNASFEGANAAYRPAEGAQLVPLSDIHTDPARFQPRRGLSEPRVKDLTDMIRQEGYKASKPITLWKDPADGKLYTLAGHHRLEAAARAGLTEIPAVIQPGTEEAAVALARRSNSTRAPMSAMEEARAFKAEIDRGAGISEIAKNYGGLKTSEVTRKLELNNLPPTLQDLVDSGQFTVNHAVELGRAAREFKFSPTLQQEIFNEVVKKMDLTPVQFRTMMDTLGPAAAKQIDMGLGFSLDQGILGPLKELSSKMGALERAKRQLSGFVRYVDAETKAGRKISGAQMSARNTAERQVNRLVREITDVQRSVGRAARARMPEAVSRLGERGSATIGPEAKEPAGPATIAVEERIGKHQDPAFSAKDAVHQLYQDTIDRFHSISRYTQLATDGYTKKIAPGENPVLLARSYLGVSGKADVFLRHKTFRNTPSGNVEFTGPGLDVIIQPMKNDMADLDNYLVARRTLDLAKRDIETGVPPETAAEAVRELEEKYPQIKDVAEGIQKWNDSLLRYLVDSGRIGEHNFEAIKEANQFYAPMQRVMDEADNPEFFTKNKNVFNRVINPIKKIEGSKRLIISPVESLIRNTFSIMDAADRNAVARAVVRLREISPALEELIVPRGTQGNGTITVYEGGKAKHYEVPKDLRATMQGLNEEGSGLLMQILSFPARALRAGATLTPEFAARNPLRDQWNAMINAKFGFIPGWDFQKGLFSMAKSDEAYQKWLASGGAQSFLVSMSKAIDDVRYHPPTGYGAKLKQYVKNPLRILEDLSEMSEKPTRIGVFRKASAAGASDIEAGFESREATTDFSRRGAKTKSINQIYAFFNARLQGVEKTARAMKERPVRSMLGAAPLILASVYNYLAYKDDEEYKELPKWRKLLFWNFKVGTRSGKHEIPTLLKPIVYYSGDHVWVGIPKGDVGVLFGGTAEKILEFVDQHDPSKLKAFASDLLDQISPIDVKGGGYIPTGLKPLVENAANYSFFRQRPIVQQGKQGLLPEYQFNNYDTEISKAVGKALGVSPSKVTNLISGYTGGLGRYAMDASDFIGTKAGQLPKRPATPRQLADLPLARGFLARNPIGFGSNSVNDFYTNWNQINQARDSLKKMPAESRKIFYDHPEVVAYKGFERAAQALGLLRKKREQVMDSIWPVEKKKEVGDRIDEQVTTLARRMNVEFERLRKK